MSTFDISSQTALLREGRNVLAIQGLNDDADDEEFFLAPELTASGQVQVGHYFDVPTPGKANNAEVLNVLASPQFSPERGLYAAPFMLTLSSDATGAVIRYTTDGSLPTDTGGQIYSGPILISCDNVRSRRGVQARLDDQRWSTRIRTSWSTKSRNSRPSPPGSRPPGTAHSVTMRWTRTS